MHEGLIIQQTKRGYRVHDHPHVFHPRHLYAEWQDCFGALMCHKVSSAKPDFLSSLLMPPCWDLCSQSPLGGKGSGAFAVHRAALCFLTHQNMLFNSKGKVATFSPKIAIAKVKGCRLKNNNYPCNIQCFLTCSDVTTNQDYVLVFLIAASFKPKKHCVLSSIKSCRNQKVGGFIV